MKLVPARDPDVIADEARGLREYAGLSREQLAARLSVSPLEVSAWESGTIAVPPAQSERLRYEAEAAWYERALRAAGVPPCAWKADNEARLEAMRSEGAVRVWMADSERLGHEARCPACIARSEFGRTEPAPEPPTEALGALGRWMRAVRRQVPRTLHPVLNLAASGLVLAIAVGALGWLTGDDAGTSLGAWAMGMLIGISFDLGFRAVARSWSDAPALAAFLLAVITALPAATVAVFVFDDFGFSGVAFWTLLPATISAVLARRAANRPMTAVSSASAAHSEAARS